MMNVVPNSGSSNYCFPSVDVFLKLCKPFLKTYFKIPAIFSMTKNHIFKFDSIRYETIFVKDFSFSMEGNVFDIIWRDASVSIIGVEAGFVFTIAH